MTPVYVSSLFDANPVTPTCKSPRTAMAVLGLCTIDLPCPQAILFSMVVKSKCLSFDIVGVCKDVSAKHAIGEVHRASGTQCITTVCSSKAQFYADAVTVYA